jgi:acyl-coenzyme A synthetase/AMP-(fatty) acid ligase
VKWLGQHHRVRPQTPQALHPETLIEMLSSGTTGPPKRIPLARSNFNRSLHSAAAYEKARGASGPMLRSGVRLQTAPLTHISGLFGALMTLAEGRKLVLIEKFSVDSWVAAVERTRPRIGNLPPAALRMILDAEVPKERLTSLLALRCGTAPLDPAVIDAFWERYGLPVLVQYGATEFAGSVAGWEIQAFRDHYGAKRGSVGRIQPGIEARIVDAESGETLPFGQQGILELRGQQLGDGDRWVRTTDRASMDADQYLWIHGRADNVINRGGFKIQPDDVVRALQEHPAIREAAVVGAPDRRLGETPVAAIILAAGRAAPAIGELRAFLTEKLLPYQIPTAFLFVPELPRTPSLKPSLPEVRRLFADVEDKA